jgi:hypothetical protein
MRDDRPILPVDLKIVTSAESNIPIETLKKALSKVSGVKEIEQSTDDPSIVTVQFQGKCDQYVKLEAAAAKEGITALIYGHCHVKIGLVPQKNANLKLFEENLLSLKGVSGYDLKGAIVGLHADLGKLSVNDLRKTAKDHGFEIVIDGSYAYVSYQVVEGEYSDFVKTIKARKGVMKVDDCGDNTVGVWVNLSYLHPLEIEKTAGFKLAKK